MLTEEQINWLFKKEEEIRKAFPGDPFAKENDVSVELADALDKIFYESNENETVRRWIINILHMYQDRHIILTGKGHTEHEWAQAYVEKYGLKGVFDD